MVSVPRVLNLYPKDGFVYKRAIHMLIPLTVRNTISVSNAVVDGVSMNMPVSRDTLS